MTANNAALTPHTFSRCEKYIAEQRGNWQHTDREDRAGYFWYETRSQDSQLLNCVIFKEIQKINTVLWLFHVSWQITVLPPFKHVNESFHIYFKPEINMNKHQKVFNFNRGTHHFSSLNPPKLICSSVWFVVKARRDTAAATGHVYLQNFQADNIMWNLWKSFHHSFITLEQGFSKFTFKGPNGNYHQRQKVRNNWY